MVYEKMADGEWVEGRREHRTWSPWGQPLILLPVGPPCRREHIGWRMRCIRMLGPRYGPHGSGGPAAEAVRRRGPGLPAASAALALAARATGMGGGHRCDVHNTNGKQVLWRHLRMPLGVPALFCCSRQCALRRRHMLCCTVSFPPLNTFSPPCAAAAMRTHAIWRCAGAVMATPSGPFCGI